MQDVDDMNHGVEAHEGCHIYGWMDVQRVAGNLHISVHVDDYMMLAQVRARTANSWQPSSLYGQHCDVCGSDADTDRDPKAVAATAASDREWHGNDRGKHPSLLLWFDIIGSYVLAPLAHSSILRSSPMIQASSTSAT